MEDEDRMDAPNEPDAPMKSDASSCFVVVSRSALCGCRTFKQRQPCGEIAELILERCGSPLLLL